jgi:hypothetical protein
MMLFFAGLLFSSAVGAPRGQYIGGPGQSFSAVPRHGAPIGPCRDNAVNKAQRGSFYNN